MERRTDKMKLGVFVMPSGHHIGAWRHPASWAMHDVNEYCRLAQKLEAAKFHVFFLADSLVADIDDLDTVSRKSLGALMYPFEPITLVGALASVTKNIGLVATASTTFSEPFNIARQYNSLDNISGGRVGWNVVTSWQPGTADNYSSQRIPDHDARYERAEEFVDVVQGLWDCWDDGAFILDRAGGRYFDPGKVRHLNHNGKYFTCRGPLNLPRSPQGQPVIVQAGTSVPGRNLSARVGEMLFTAHQQIDDAVEHYADVKRRAAGFGRSPSDIAVLPGIVPVVGRTEAEAQAKLAELRALIHPDVALSMLTIFCKEEIDLKQYPADGPVPTIPPTEGQKSRMAIMLEMGRRENLTLGQLAQRFCEGRGHWLVVGTATQVADKMEECFMRYGCDGFNVSPATFPQGLDDFIELIIPELRRRGLFHTEYEGTTLRENLGLKRPERRAGQAVPAESEVAIEAL